MIKWTYNPMTGNYIANYKGKRIIRLQNESGKLPNYYSVEIRFGLDCNLLTFNSLGKAKAAIDDEIRRTTHG